MCVKLRNIHDTNISSCHTELLQGCHSLLLQSFFFIQILRNIISNYYQILQIVVQVQNSLHLVNLNVFRDSEHKTVPVPMLLITKLLRLIGALQASRKNLNGVECELSPLITSKTSILRHKQILPYSLIFVGSYNPTF